MKFMLNLVGLVMKLGLVGFLWIAVSYFCWFEWYFMVLYGYKSSYFFELPIPHLNYVLLLKLFTRFVA